MAFLFIDFCRPLSYNKCSIESGDIMKTILPYCLLFLSLLLNLSFGCLLLVCRRRYRSLLFKSRTDELTGLLNRFACMEEINKELGRSSEQHKSGSEQSKAFFLIDLDNFKHINDTYGHRTGDDVLVLLSCCMQNLFSEHAVLGRWGGDEFLVFLDPAGTANQVGDKAGMLCRALEQAVREHDYPFRVTISIGIVTAKSGEDFSAMMQRADRALYYVKNHGKSSFYIDGSC